MHFRTKRVLAFLTVASYLFLTGLENAIILPTAWKYLEFLGATEDYLLGLTLSGFSACAMISGLIGGRLSDSFPYRSKRIILVALIAMIAGNLQYMFGGSVVNLIMGRVVCGIGACAGATLLAEVGRTTSARERTFVLSVCNGLRQVGLLIGPAFQLVLEYFDFSLFNGALVVRPFSAPGLFMAILWTVFSIYTLLAYQNLDIEYKYELLRREHAGQDLSGYSMELTCSGEELVEPPSPAIRRWYFLDETFSRQTPERPVTWFTYFDEFLHDDTVVLFGMAMVLFFCQVSVETMIPPVTSRLFNFTSYETSFVYMVAGCISISVYALIALTTRYTSDIYLLTLGWTLQILSYIWFLVWLPLIQPSDTTKMPMFLVGVLLAYIGFPVASVGSTSLLSKCVSLRTQGVAHGFRRMGTFSGLILGPMWTGATLREPYLQTSIPLAMLLFMAILFGFTFRKIQKEERWALSMRK